jgi:hypothetical protein
MQGMGGGMGGMQGMDSMGGMGGGMPQIQRQAQRQKPKSKGPPVLHKLLLSLEDLYTGTTKKMRITSKRYIHVYGHIYIMLIQTIHMHTYIYICAYTSIYIDRYIYIHIRYLIWIDT